MFFKKDKMFETVFIGKKNGREYYAVKQRKNNKFYFIAYLLENKVLVVHSIPRFNTVIECRR